jgi:hypothetical protein
MNKKNVRSEKEKKENSHCSSSRFLHWGMDIGAPVQSPRGSIPRQGSGSSIQEEVPRERTTDTSIWTGDRGEKPPHRTICRQWARQKRCHDELTANKLVFASDVKVTTAEN